MWKSTSELRSVDGVGRLKFDIHTAASAAAPEKPSAFSEKVSASATSIKAEAARNAVGRRSTKKRRSTSDPSHAPSNPATCVEIKLQAPHAIVALLSP